MSDTPRANRLAANFREPREIAFQNAVSEVAALERELAEERKWHSIAIDREGELMEQRSYAERSAVLLRELREEIGNAEWGSNSHGAAMFFEFIRKWTKRIDRANVIQEAVSSNPAPSAESHSAAAQSAAGDVSGGAGPARMVSVTTAFQQPICKACGRAIAQGASSQGRGWVGPEGSGFEMWHHPACPPAGDVHSQCKSEDDCEWQPWCRINGRCMGGEDALIKGELGSVTIRPSERNEIGVAPAPQPIEAGDRLATMICVGCDGTGWCEGSPAFTCPDCKGAGQVGQLLKGAAKSTPSAGASPLPPFAEAWAVMEKRGYQYGRDALENVETGYDLARELLGVGASPKGDE